MDDILVQREITITVRGPQAVVDALATTLAVQISGLLPPSEVGKLRVSTSYRKDFLDADWNVIPAEQIVAAAVDRDGDSICRCHDRLPHAPGVDAQCIYFTAMEK